MNTSKNKKILLLVLMLSLLVLTSCTDMSDDDWELVEIAFESWAEENGLLENDQWQPEGVVVKAVEDTIKDITNNQDKVQIDGLDVIRDIEKADELAREAREKNDEDKIKEAIELRPYDWRLREQHAALTLFEDDIDGGYEIIDSNAILQNQIKNGADCLNLRTHQLEYRDELLQEYIEIENPNNDAGQTLSQYEMKKDQLTYQEELQDIYANGHSWFCDNMNK